MKERLTEFIKHTSVTVHLSNYDNKQNICLKALAAYYNPHGINILNYAYIAAPDCCHLAI